MSKKKSEENSKYDLLTKIMSYVIIFFMFIIFVVDRALHIILPHKEHDKFTSWAKDKNNVKFAFARLIIFTIPISIFKIFF